MSSTSLLWLRRNLRIEDNKVLHTALSKSSKLLPIFIFDSDILQHFPYEYDRRVHFIASAICHINQLLNQWHGKVIVLYGKSTEIIPKLVDTLSISDVYADEDFEPASIKRDNLIKQSLKNNATLHLVLDHLLLHPSKVLNNENNPYKVYTPYMNKFRLILSNSEIENYNIDIDNLSSKFVASDALSNINQHFKVIDTEGGAKKVLSQIGYAYKEESLWKVEEAKNKLNNFISNKIASYKQDRDYLALQGTSSISPYLRFGIISVRECYSLAKAIEGSYSWVNELIWREFYTMILFYFPWTIEKEFQVKYCNVPWERNAEIFKKFAQARTGFPIIDAAVNQLVQEGWMHNRARMVVGSFFTKNLFMDWRLGESFFARYLMDYELSSNVGGWQWVSSCGTDAQPYFRIFNPFTQGKNFDPNGSYVKKYLPILAGFDNQILHNQQKIEQGQLSSALYPKPIIVYNETRKKFIDLFKDYD